MDFFAVKVDGSDVIAEISLYENLFTTDLKIGLDRATHCSDATEISNMAAGGPFNMVAVGNNKSIL